MSFPLTIATGKEYSHITHEEAVRIWNSAKLPEVRMVPTNKTSGSKIQQT